ncbi:MAG: FecR domain-containing protein [Sinobacteraceae bacterium]|nr:FecR domain-containing protein [Nevskiaceae bacterium]
MGITRRTRKQISAEAVDWFLRLQETAAAELHRHGFSEWLLRSPVHLEEYLRVSCSWSLLNVGTHGLFNADELITAAKKHHEADNVVPLPTRFRGRTLLSRRERGVSNRGWRVALAAALLVGIGLSVTYLSWHLPMTFQTVVGEQRSFTLQDGSIVFLNTNSKVRVRWLPQERHIDLVRGEARFKVAKDALRPFIVATTTAGVRAVGTIFNVRAEPASTQVAVLEGQVEVTVASTPEVAENTQAPAKEGSAAVPARTSSRVRLAAGERAAVTSVGIETNTGPPIESVMAWTDRRLVFRDQPLTAVLREFNRYRVQPLVLDDPALAALKISGVFDLSDPESLIAYLSLYETVQVDRRSDGSQHLFRAPLPDLRKVR